MTGFGRFVAPAVTVALTVATLVTSALPASAMIACSKSGECWHVRDYYVFRPEFGVTVHPDNWHPRERVRWRDHDGRGYWHKGVWVSF